MYFNLIPFLRKKSAALVSHMDTNNSSNETFQVYDKLLDLVHFVKGNNPNCHVLLPSPIDRLDDGEAALTKSSLEITDNSNIGDSFLGMHRLNLNEHVAGKLALNFVERIRSIRNSGSATQKLKGVHSKISNFWRSSDNPKSDRPETIYALLHNLNEETMKCQNILAFSTSKNSMIMSNFSAKENTNVEGKTENESKIQDESQKCENFTDFLFNIRKHHSIKIIIISI